MNIRYFFFAAFIIPAIVILSGCGVRKKSLLLKLSSGMTKEEVKLKIGQPDEIRNPVTVSNGDVIDIWEYSLATVDENQESKRLGVAIGCFCLCPLLPLGFIPLACMDSPYTYDTYFLKFVNELLSRWGRRSDVGLPAQPEMASVKKKLIG